MTEYIEPSFGVFKIEMDAKLPDVFHLSLHLDYYQSNCLRMWLDMRWQSSSLRNSTLLLLKPSQLLIRKSVIMPPTKPVDVLNQWKTEVTRQFNLFVNNRR